MPRWIGRAVERIRRLVAEERVTFTEKALRELEDLAMDPVQARKELLALTPRDGFERRRSSISGEYLYIFKRAWNDLVVYLKIVIRHNCVVISFHEDRDSNDETNGI